MSVIQKLKDLINAHNYAEFSRILPKVIKKHNELEDLHLSWVSKIAILEMAKIAIAADEIPCLFLLLAVRNFQEPELKELLKLAVQKKQHIVIMKLLQSQARLDNPLSNYVELTEAMQIDYQARVYLANMIKLIKDSSGFFQSLVSQSTQPMMDALLQSLQTLPEVFGQFLDMIMSGQIKNPFTENEWKIFRSLVETVDFRYMRYLDNTKFMNYQYVASDPEPEYVQFKYHSVSTINSRWYYLWVNAYPEKRPIIFTALLDPDDDVQLGLNINTKMKSGYGIELSPLLIAAKANNFQVADLLLKFRLIDVNLNIDGRVALLISTKHEDSKILERLLTVPGINLQIANSEGTAIKHALHHNNAKAITLLLKAGAAPENTLFEAIRLDRRSCVLAYLEACPVKTSDITTILHKALFGSNQESSTLNWFIEQIILSKTKETKLTEKVNLSLLYQHFPFDLNQKYERDQTLLHTAALRGASALLEELLVIPEVDLSKHHVNGETLLQFARSKNQNEVVAVLEKPRARNYAELISALLNRTFMQKMNRYTIERNIIFCTGFNSKNIIDGVKRLIDLYWAIEWPHILSEYPDKVLTDVCKIDAKLIEEFIAALKAQPAVHPFSEEKIQQVATLIKNASGQDLVLQTKKIEEQKPVAVAVKRKTIGEIYQAEKQKAEAVSSSSSSSSEVVTREQAEQMARLASARTERPVSTLEQGNAFGLSEDNNQLLDQVNGL